MRGGTRLDAPQVAKTVSRGADGQPVVTDGPFLELKEVVGGYVHLECDDFDFDATPNAEPIGVLAAA
ncbi:hypothetical protein AB0H57_18650 [Micromonospora sp. NPDC050686]|uniref:YciI family protein n=1 Tax=Micromonospora sp. NPDC050686 TaxID=3154631 RepID=UPI0033FE23D1